MDKEMTSLISTFFKDLEKELNTTTSIIFMDDFSSRFESLKAQEKDTDVLNTSFDSLGYLFFYSLRTHFAYNLPIKQN